MGTTTHSISRGTGIGLHLEGARGDAPLGFGKVTAVPVSLRAALLLCTMAGGCHGSVGSEGETRSVAGSPFGIVVEELGWEEIARYEPGDAIAARFNPTDGAIYYGGRSSNNSQRGLWRIPANGVPERVGSNNQVGGLAVDPVSGDVFFGDDFGGSIFRAEAGSGSPSVWVSGFQAGDDDPVGIGVAPRDYEGPLLAPGEMAVVDRGNGGPDVVWAFSPETPQGERLIHPDNGTLVDGVDVAVSRTDIYVADRGAGIIYRLLADQTLEAVSTDVPVRPLSLAVDPASQELLVVDADTNTLLRLAPATGETSVVFSGLLLNNTNWSSLGVSEDGKRVVITERDTASQGTITVFELPDNFRPVARCRDVEVVIGAFDCTADISVDAGSFDPEDGAVALEQSPPGPYSVGETEVVLTATDSLGKAASCEATVRVRSDSTAWIATNGVSDPSVHRGFNDHGLLAWKFFGGGSAVFDTDGVFFEAANDDSWARLWGPLRVRFDGAYGTFDGDPWLADVAFERAPPGTTPRRELLDPAVNQPPEVTDAWRYFTLARGSTLLPADDSSSATLVRLGFQNYGFQLGDAANGRNTNFGLSGWLLYTHTIDDIATLRGFAQFNLDLTPVCQ